LIISDHGSDMARRPPVGQRCINVYKRLTTLGAMEEGRAQETSVLDPHCLQPLTYTKGQRHTPDWLIIMGWDYVSELLPLAVILFIPQMIWVWRETAEWYWQGKTEELGEKPVSVLLCPPQIPHGFTCTRTRTSAVRGRRQTAWSMARPVTPLGPS
jgi:hypothetical protein